MTHVLIKVKLWGRSTVTAIETQGYPGKSGYWKLYRLETSLDCINFQPVLDDAGNNQVFSK